MPAHFWFEERGTETYSRRPSKVTKHYIKEGKTAKSSTSREYQQDEKGTYFTTEDIDWNSSKFIPCTREEYEAERASGEYVHNRIWQKRENTELQRADELICEFMGEPRPNRDYDSTFYHWCHETAFWVLYSNGGGFIGDKPDEGKADHMEELHKRMDDWIERVRADRKDHPIVKKLEDEGYRARCHALIDWVFVTKWEFHATGN